MGDPPTLGAPTHQHGSASSESDEETLESPAETPTIFQGRLFKMLLSSTTRQIWGKYCAFVQKHERVLDMIDRSVATFLFWSPSMSRKREILYGFLSVHRMMLDAAFQSTLEKNSFGTTIQPDDAPTLPATAARRLLTVLHNLLPTLLELSPDPLKPRVFVERFKFVVRTWLLVSYWRQLRKQDNISSSSAVVAGLLQRGGMFYPEVENAVAPTVKHQQRQFERSSYVGRRTGRRIVPVGSSADGKETQSKQTMWIRHVVGELLHCSRPLYWAHAEGEFGYASHRRQWQLWMVSLAMYAISLHCLNSRAIRNNPLSDAEWTRRRTNLLFYLLRSPAWEQVTNPMLERLACVLGRVPILGAPVHIHLRDWLIHLRHPLFTEEE